MLRQVQTLVGAVMGSVVVIAIVLGVAFQEEDLFAAPPVWLVAAQVAAAVAVHLLAETVGYRATPLHVETDEASARTTSVQVYVSRTVLRMALCESIALASVAAAFLVDSGGYAGILTGCAVSLVLLAVHAWPHRGPVERTAAALERDGARSYLREELGIGVPGPIQEL